MADPASPLVYLHDVEAWHHCRGNCTHPHSGEVDPECAHVFLTTFAAFHLDGTPDQLRYINRGELARGSAYAVAEGPAFPTREAAIADLLKVLAQARDSRLDQVRHYEGTVARLREEADRAASATAVIRHVLRQQDTSGGDQ